MEESHKATPKVGFIRPNKPAAEMTDEEIDTLAMQLADQMGLTFPDDPKPEEPSKPDQG